LPAITSIAAESPPAATTETKQPPNVIVVNLDDIGPAWFPPYARDIKPEDVEQKICDEYAKLHEVRCEGIEDVNTAFAAMAAFAAETKCTKFLYHATINLKPGERLTRDQWRIAVDTA